MWMKEFFVNMALQKSNAMNRKEGRMNIKINFRIEAVFCLLEQITKAVRLLDDVSKLEE